MKTQKMIGKLICRDEATVNLEVILNYGEPDYDKRQYQDRVFAREHLEGVINLERQSFVEITITSKPGTVLFKFKDVTESIDPKGFEIPFEHLYAGLEDFDLTGNLQDT